MADPCRESTTYGGPATRAASRPATRAPNLIGDHSRECGAATKPEWTGDQVGASNGELRVDREQSRKCAATQVCERNWAWRASNVYDVRETVGRRRDDEFGVGA